ncbi:hypothetical protein G6F56_004577 [Rhizopus delemar]|nr:hypothetical protein G6F56_004577 [Rhizopus delemar]
MKYVIEPLRKEGILRFRVQQQNHGDIRPELEDSELIEENSSTGDSTETIMSMDCRSSREDNGDGLCDWRNTSSYPLPTAGFVEDIEHFPARPSNPNTEHLQCQQHQCHLSTYSGGQQYGRRSSEQNQETVLRIRNTQEDIQNAQHNNQLPVYWSMNEEPTAAAADAMKQQWLPTEIFNNTDVAKPILVSDDTEDETFGTTRRMESQSEMEFNRLAIISYKRMQDGIDATTSEFLYNKIRPSTNKAYDYGWKHWVTWCKDQVPPCHCLDYNPKNVLQFLCHN